MADDIQARIIANPKFQDLVKTRNSYSFVMSIAMLVVYFGYILLIAFNKEYLSQKIGEGMVTSIGIPMGLGVILFTIIITRIYVHRANTEFDAINAEIVKEAQK